MYDNPYRAPNSVSDAGLRWSLIRITVAVALLVFGVLNSVGAVRHGMQLLTRTAPIRDVAMFGVPTFVVATVGSVVAAVGVATSSRKRTAIGIFLLVAGIGGWATFLYASVSRFA